ncbi:MAG: patatin-like phospholipase family protein [Deltaproteobacteria bacterium]|nr:patatin-like phospholipase family protein [Deltaproteobacteria bacterium]
MPTFHLRALHLVAVFILYWTFLLSAPAIALDKNDSPDQQAPPKIGLVLAGGGALGFAHVGVLRVLEEHRIPVHLVTGTSMGSIVGAAYASGVTLPEMERLLKETDWDALFSESANRRSQPFRFKPGRNREIYGDVKIGIRQGSLVVPTGIVQGQNVLPLLQRLYEKSSSPADFDKLPLPFRAVTADLETGQAVIPKEGDLATIVRASMSVPGFFAPIEHNGKLLVDGGIVNNLPVDVALELGADVLIVVELYADLKRRDELGTPLAVGGQIISLLLAQNSELQRGLMREKDILITPDLKGYSATDFVKGDELEKLGEEAALKVVDQLKRLSVTPAEYRSYQRRRILDYKTDARIAFIRIENQSKYPEHRIKEQLGIGEKESFDRNAVERGIKRLFDTGQFREVTYSTVETDEGKGLIVRLKEKEFLKQYIRVGAAIEDDFEGDSNYRLGLAYRNTDFDINGTYVDLRGEIGQTPRFSAEWFQPLSSEMPYFIAPTITIGRNDLRLRSNGEDIALYQRLSGSAGLAAGRELGTIGEARVTYRRGFGDLERDIGSAELPEFGYDTADLIGGIDLDALDIPDFPTSGFAARLAHIASVEELGASDSFNTIAGGLQLPYSFGKSTIAFGGDFANTFESRPVERSFSLGGFVDLPGYAPHSLVASDYHVLRLFYYYRFSELKTPLFGFRFFSGGSINFASLKSDLPAVPDNPELWAGSLFLGADTPIVPTYLGVGFAEEGEAAIYIAIGRLGIPERE